MILQILGELVEVETPVFVLVTRRHYFLRRGNENSSFAFCCEEGEDSHAHNQRHSRTPHEFHANSAGLSQKLPVRCIGPPWTLRLYLCSTLAEYSHCFQARSQLSNVHLPIFVSIEPLEQVLIGPLTVGIPTPGIRE